MDACQKIRMKKIKEIIRRENEYEFPDFLRLLRESVGGNRKSVAKELNMSDFLLYHWEHGNFKRSIKPHNLALISDYYDIPFSMLNAKMKKYLESKE